MRNNTQSRVSVKRNWRANYAYKLSVACKQMQNLFLFLPPPSILRALKFCPNLCLVPTASSVERLTHAHPNAHISIIPSLTKAHTTYFMVFLLASSLPSMRIASSLRALLSASSMM